ncbi:unnamed protein product [Schistosoma margrebowiei]|uniref:Uncharacterized protein n=1 Tax=Schistosoma margrebowiei TaxID=48269 RepID=A0A183LDS9_9TREM|nr:unnamed protein product [Schistosoma margrebowiei]
MVVEGSQQKTMNQGFVLLGTRWQGVSVILSELVFGKCNVGIIFGISDTQQSTMVHMKDEVLMDSQFICIQKIKCSGI